MGLLQIPAKALMILVLMTLAVAAAGAIATEDCSTVTGLISACTSFITYGSPDPLPGSPCCDGMSTLGTVVDSGGGGAGVCRCLMGLIATYNPNATAIATLPGFCGIDMGFIIDPNTDCSNAP
ncbi:Putative non-specific lipid-transfer protein 14 [Linum grandiflorum]